MNVFLKVAVGVIGGIAIVGSLCFGERKKKQEETFSNFPDSIPDEPLNLEQQQNTDSLQTKTEENIRNLQSGLNKASNVLEQIGNIVRSVIRIFYGNNNNYYGDNDIYTSPTTIIY